MSIDWFTFTAQILNFLVLVWLLKRFLYSPIINAMEQREVMMAGRLSKAMAAQQQAAKTEQEYRDKLNDLANTREELLAEAGREVAVWRVDHLQQAKSEVEAAREQWRRGLSREKHALYRELQLTATQHATDLGRHLLQQLADERLQTRLVEHFLSLLETSDPNAGLLKSLRNDQPVQVETSHALTTAEQQKIADVLIRISSQQPKLDFRVNSLLVCGIEVRAPGCKLAWSIRDSLAEMESSLIDAIDNVIPDQMALETSDARNRQSTEAAAL